MPDLEPKEGDFPLVANSTRSVLGCWIVLVGPALVIKIWEWAGYFG